MNSSTERPGILATEVPSISARPRVGENGLTLRVDDPDAFQGCLDNPSEPLFAFPELDLGLPAVGDVEARADVPGKGAVRCEPGNTVVQDPAVFAVVPPEPVFHHERRPGVERSQVGLQTPLPIIRVNALRPAAAHLLFDGPPREVQPLLVEVITALVCVRAPDQYWRGISQFSKPLLTLAIGLFSPMPLGDISEDDDSTLDLAMRVSDGRGIVFDGIARSHPCR